MIDMNVILLHIFYYFRTPPKRFIYLFEPIQTISVYTMGDIFKQGEYRMLGVINRVFDWVMFGGSQNC